MIIYQTTMDTVTSQPFNRETFVTKKTSSRISFVHLSLKICFISSWKRRKNYCFFSSNCLKMLLLVTVASCMEQLLSFLKSIASWFIYIFKTADIIQQGVLDGWWIILALTREASHFIVLWTKNADSYNFGNDNKCLSSYAWACMYRLVIVIFIMGIYVSTD